LMSTPIEGGRSGHRGQGFTAAGVTNLKGITAALNVPAPVGRLIGVRYRSRGC